MSKVGRVFIPSILIPISIYWYLYQSVFIPINRLGSFQPISALESWLWNIHCPSLLWLYVVSSYPWAYRWTQYFDSFICLLQFSPSVVSNSLWPCELQHARPPYPSPTAGVYPNPCPLSWWCHPTISSSVVPFSSCPQPFPASGSFQMSQLLASGGQSIGFSASTSVLPVIGKYYIFMDSRYVFKSVVTKRLLSILLQKSFVTSEVHTLC